MSGLKYIVPIPYSCGFEIGASGEPEPRLSVFSQIVVEACAQQWHDRSGLTGSESPRIILAAETPLSKDYPTTADLMTQGLLGKGVPKDRIIDLDQTRDPSRPMNWTTRHIGAVAEFTKPDTGLAPEAIRLVPLAYHLPRVAIHAAAFGLRPSISSAEEILGPESLKPYERALQLLLDSVAPSERCLRLLAHFDGKGRLLELIDKLSGDRGSRILDVVGDRLVKETSSKRYFTQLQQSALRNA